jgi:hypothetical protein
MNVYDGSDIDSCDASSQVQPSRLTWREVAQEVVCLAGPILLRPSGEAYRRLIRILSLLVVALFLLLALAATVRIQLPNLPELPELPVPQLLH